jgi:hypothetical protein
VLANSAQEATTIIGTGLLDALKALSKDNTVDDLASDMERAALASADFIRGLGQIGSFELKGETRSLIGILTTPLRRSLSAGPLGAITRLGQQSRVGSGGGFPQGAPAELKALSQYSKVQDKIVKNAKILTAEEKKRLSAAKLKLALEKANLALLKGEEIFDMDKIQIAAALTNQAEQLGRATSSAQVLQIANDTARLNVKKSILALEDAIAAKDEAAITAATNKLNADMKILNALTGQNTQMKAIESILAGLKPKELIDQKNLDEALRKIRQMLDELAKVKTPTLGGGGGGGSTGGGGGSGGASVAPATFASVAAKEAYDAVTYFAQKATDAFQTVEDSGAFNALVNMYAGGAINPFNAGSFRMAEGGTVFNSGAVGSRDRDIVINVNTGIGDPNAIAEAIDNVLREARDRGTLTIA